MNAAPVAQEQNDHGQWVDIPAEPPTSSASGEPPAAPVTADAAATSTLPPAADAKVADVPPKGKPRNDPEARIAEMRAKQGEAERRADEAERRLRELEARNKPAIDEKPAAKAADDPEPNPTDLTKYPEGQFDRAFLKDQARWEARQEMKAAQVREREDAALAARYQSFETRALKFKEAVGTDEAVIAQIDQRLFSTPPTSLLLPTETPTFGNFLIEQLLDSDHPKELAIHLSDRAVIQRLATLPPSQVIRALAKFEASLGAADRTGSAPKEPTKSKAAAPVTPVTGTAQVSASDEPGDDASDDEWYRWQKAHGKLRRA